MAEGSDIRLTEERLRHHLDGNQMMQERMCLALLPLLGPYARERPRRPKGGPDGGRDIEAVYQGAIGIWGAVGFRNGGGADNSSRSWAARKFKEDIARAREENPSLQGFVFFTNVDLTPDGKETLLRHAQSMGFRIAEIFDYEVIRHVLDSSEGLITRLQYLDIPMTPTEQIALVGKFGNQLQNAITARFDRVERTLYQMERFIDMQKPILRIDFYLELLQPCTTAQVGNEAYFVQIQGLQDLTKTASHLLIFHTSHRRANETLVMWPHLWLEEKRSEVITTIPMLGQHPNIACAYSEISLTAGGRRVSLADATRLNFSAWCTEGLRSRVRHLAVDVNGYELFSYPADALSLDTSLTWPDGIAYNPGTYKWIRLVSEKTRNLLEEPPERSPRFLKLIRTSD